MAANPQIPPTEPPYRHEKIEPVNTGHGIPWSIIAVIGTIVALGLIAYYFFR